MPAVLLIGLLVGLLMGVMTQTDLVTTTSEPGWGERQDRVGVAQEKRTVATERREARERKAARRERARRCMERALNGARTKTVSCGSQETVVCNKDGVFRITDPEGQYRVVCERDQFVGLAWNSDENHFFRRVRYLGRWVGKAVPRGHGTRLARPAPPPPPPAPAPVAPAPAAPPAPSSGGSSGGLVYTTDNDHGYTGPRCYEPDGYHFHPC